MKRDDVDNFLKEDLKGKSPTTIGNTISRIKHLFTFYGCEEETGHLNLYYVKGITNTKEIKYLTPGQVYSLIESLINYQDKALVLMCYMDLYDKDFETIRNAKRDNFKGPAFFTSSIQFSFFILHHSKNSPQDIPSPAAIHCFAATALRSSASRSVPPHTSNTGNILSRQTTAEQHSPKAKTPLPVL